MKRIVASGFLMVLPLLAHHAIRAVFDTSKTITFNGTVAQFDWINPHAYLYLDVLEASGKTTNWKFEMASPNLIRRHGAKRDFLKPGDQIMVDAWVAKDLSKLASARNLIWPDGRTMDVADRWDMPR